jgi:hypothetical protein
MTASGPIRHRFDCFAQRNTASITITRTVGLLAAAQKFPSNLESFGILLGSPCQIDAYLLVREDYTKYK